MLLYTRLEYADTFHVLSIAVEITNKPWLVGLAMEVAYDGKMLCPEPLRIMTWMRLLRVIIP